MRPPRLAALEILGFVLMMKVLDCNCLPRFDLDDYYFDGLRDVLYELKFECVDVNCTEDNKTPAPVDAKNHSFILLGATGDLSKRKIYPALWQLYRGKLLPANTTIYGYATRPMTKDAMRERIEPFVVVNPGEEKLYDEFWRSHNHDVIGSKDAVEGYDTLCRTVKEVENGNRIFYMALPPSVFPSAAAQIKRACMADQGWTRVVVEKPFGRDLETSEALSKELSSLFTEDQIYRVDHFLGYETVQNIPNVRFNNFVWNKHWNRDSVANVKIDFRETIGVEGRGRYYEESGIIRDVMQNHLLQILSLVAMDKPKSDHADDVRDEKVKLLKSTRNIEFDDVVLGQYVGNPSSSNPRERMGYRDDPSVANNSIQSTFALTVLKIDNERWFGVPFVIRAGKALNINQTQVVIQFKDIKDDLIEGKPNKNKLVIRIKSTNSSMSEGASKSHGSTNNSEESTILKFANRSKGIKVLNAYEKLILDIIHGSQLNFVRHDELKESWRIFTPILHKIDQEKIQPLSYVFGTTGPKEADDLERRYNFA